MPTLRCSHGKHFEWAIVPKDSIAPGEVFTAAAKNDEVLRRTLVEWPGNFTLAEVPEALIEREMAAREEIGQPITRNALVAEYLRKIGLRDHVPLGHLDHIECAEEPDLAAYLNTVFECSGEPAPDGGAPDPRAQQGGVPEFSAAMVQPSTGDTPPIEAETSTGQEAVS